MDLPLEPDDQRFQLEVREFLARELTPSLREATARATSVFVDRDVALEWQRRLAARGWAVPAWPVEHGGVDWTPMQRYLFESECADAGAPFLIPMGVNMVAHVIVKFGTDAQKRHYLPRILSGEDYWCQGYSEPQSGSDLASLRCRADRDGDDYVVTGTKIWTTHAQFATHIFCLVRTSTEGRLQAGISFLLIDMRSPGVTVRPILSLGGDHDVNQVFFDGVRVPQANRVGAEGQGWTCAKYLLEFERGGNVGAPRLAAALRHVKNRARAQPDGAGGVLHDAAWVRRRLAEIGLDLLSLRHTELRILASRVRGGSPGPEASILKTEHSELEQRIHELAVDLLGPYALPFELARPVTSAVGDGIGPSWRAPAVPRYLNGRAATIYAGSNEIQRNLIARNVLGL
jgi:acyl-CoA dehydrogenase